MNIIEETLIRNLKKFNLLDKKLVIGFSGGGDSTSLIIALYKLRKLDSKLNFEAFHVNYGLRKDSDKDQNFVENICNKFNIDLEHPESLRGKLEDMKSSNEINKILKNIKYCQQRVSNKEIAFKSYLGLISSSS